MSGQKVGYIRVSTVEQNTGRQTEQMKGEHLDVTFTDRVSGKSLDRPELDKMLKHVRAGDVVVCQSMDRLARLAASQCPQGAPDTCLVCAR